MLLYQISPIFSAHELQNCANRSGRLNRPLLFVKLSKNQDLVEIRPASEAFPLMILSKLAGLQGFLRCIIKNKFKRKTERAEDFSAG